MTEGSQPSLVFSDMCIVTSEYIWSSVSVSTAAVLIADLAASEGAQGSSIGQEVIWKTHIPSPTIKVVIAL